MENKTDLELGPLLEEMRQLDQRIESLRATQRAEALRQARELVDMYQFTPAELFRSVAAPRRRVAPKYQDPVTGATWSGRGRAPRWLQGKDFAAYLIGNETQGMEARSPDC